MGSHRGEHSLVEVTAVSVLLPTYERPDLLREALDSALAQQFTDIEVLVGDNSDSATTENLVAGYDDPRICYHRNRPGLGPQGNWLDLVERAQAPLVATLHDDDVWHPEFLSTMAPPMMADPTVAMTFNDFWVIDGNGARLEEFTEHESARSHRRELASGNLCLNRDDGLRLVAVWNAPQPAYAAVIRRDEILACEFPPSTWPLYDIWLSYHLVHHEKTLRYERRRLTYYRHHSGSLTSRGFAEAEDAVFSLILEQNPDSAVAGEILRYWSGLRWARATTVMRHGGDADWGRRELKDASAGLEGWKRAVASAASRSPLVWHGLKLAKSWRHDNHGANAA